MRAEPVGPLRQTAGPVGDGLHRALTLPVAKGDPVDPEALRDEVAEAWRDWQTSPRRYSRLTRTLPRLIMSVEGALLAHRGDDMGGGRRQVHRCAVDLYALVRTVAKRLGRVDLSLLAADRAIRAGEAADDPLRLAVARWNSAQVLLADAEPEGAEQIALHGVAELGAAGMGDSDMDAPALRGSLLLVAAVAAAWAR